MKFNPKIFDIRDVVQKQTQKEDIVRWAREGMSEVVINNSQVQKDNSKNLYLKKTNG